MRYVERLSKVLKEYKGLKRSSFHTPGHKNNCNFLNELLSFDFTELDYTDSLFEANGAILKAEEYASKVFGSIRTLFSAGGCTLCIQAMLRLVGKSGGKVICSRVLHKSAINAMALLNLKPIFIEQDKDLKTGFLNPVKPMDVEVALKTNEDVNVVYLTSPDYFGVLSDVKKISKICKSYNVPLIVDNAHGSHLAFLEENLHPLHFGADMTADSLHKTLPVLTGGALLHINNEKYISRAKQAMALFGSTSPSYPIMASLDLCSDWIENNAKMEYKRLIDNIKPIKNILKEKGILMPEGLVDPTRISLNLKSVGLTGFECAELFRKFGLEPEVYTKDFIVLILTPFNKEKDFLKLKNALMALEVRDSKTENKFFFQKELHLKTSLNEAILSESEVIEVRKSKNRISAGTVCPCPPGVPIVIPGETITREHIEFLLSCGILFIEVIK